MTPEKEALCRAFMPHALERGAASLAAGSRAIDTAEQAGTGGWIALGREGGAEIPLNTQDMHREWIRLADRVPSVAIYVGE